MTRIANPAKVARMAVYWREHGRPDVAERLEAPLVASGRCRICGRKLTNPESRSRGVGPECWGKIQTTVGPAELAPESAPTAPGHRLISDNGVTLVCECGQQFDSVWMYGFHSEQAAGQAGA